MGSILIVDCDVRSAEDLRAQLAELGRTVLMAREPIEALLHADEPIDLILIDLAMPNHDTQALVAKLRAKTTAPLIACVRTTRKIDMVFALRQGFIDWLEKPVVASELKAALSRDRAERAPAVVAATAGQGGVPATTGPGMRPKGVVLLQDVVQMVRDGTISVPQMPQVVVRLRDLLKDPEADPNEVIRLVESDPGIASRVTAMAASPVFGPGMGHLTIRSAVARLGVRQLQSLVETSALTNLFPAPARELAETFRAKWSLIVTSACLAREIAANVEGVDSSEAYLLVLFQDVGELFLLTVLSRFDGRSNDSAIESWHGQFGASLLSKWGMSSVFGMVARHHHDPTYDAIADPRQRQQLHVVNLANRLVWAAMPATGETQAARVGPSALASSHALGLSDERHERLEARVAEVQREVASLLG